MQNKVAIMRVLILLTLLTACNATGAKYTGSEGGNLVIYRPSHILYSAMYYPIDINSVPACNIGNGGFYVTTIDSPVIISVDKMELPGISRIKAKAGNYVRLEAKQERVMGTIAGGWIAGQTMEGVDQNPGPFSLSIVPEAQAKQELMGLNRDCGLN